MKGIYERSGVVSDLNFFSCATAEWRSCEGAKRVVIGMTVWTERRGLPFFEPMQQTCQISFTSGTPAYPHNPTNVMRRCDVHGLNGRSEARKYMRAYVHGASEFDLICLLRRYVGRWEFRDGIQVAIIRLFSPM